MSKSSPFKHATGLAIVAQKGKEGSIPYIDFGYNWVQEFMRRNKVIQYNGLHGDNGCSEAGHGQIQVVLGGRQLSERNFFRLFLFLLIFVHGIPFALALSQGVGFPRPGLLIPYVKDWVEYAFSFSVLVLVLSAKRFSHIQNEMVREFVEEGIVTRSRDEIAKKIDSWNKFRRDFRLQIALFLVAEISALKLLWDLLADGHASWHGIPVAGALGLKNFLGLQEMPTWCALYVCVVVWPTCNYIIFNWIVNGIRWVAFTHWMTKDLCINAMHPDQCGGMHTMKYSVLAWSALIITVGVLISFNTLTYAPLPGAATRWDIILEISGFIILALVIFLCPMCWLTWQLLDAKTNAEKVLENIGHHCASMIRANLRDMGALTLESASDLKFHIDIHTNMVALSKNIAAMKVWPLDIMSIVQIISSVGGPLTTMLIPDLVKMVFGR